MKFVSCSFATIVLVRTVKVYWNNFILKLTTYFKESTKIGKFFRQITVFLFTSNFRLLCAWPLGPLFSQYFFRCVSSKTSKNQSTSKYLCILQCYILVILIVKLKQFSSHNSHIDRQLWDMALFWRNLN